MHDIGDDDDEITKSKNEKWKENISSVKSIVKEHKNTGNQKYSGEKER